MKASNLFFLNGAHSHINVDLTSMMESTIITFWHESDKFVSDRLVVEVIKVGKEFTVSYDFNQGGNIVSQGISDPIPAISIYGTLVLLANDAFPTKEV